jgi:hypothetical protein
VVEDGVRAQARVRGLCLCGCGEQTKRALQTYRRAGHLRGAPMRYVLNHDKRRSPVEYVEEKRGLRTPCWVWQWNTTAGYPCKRIGDKKVLAHRHYFEAEYGPVPEGLEIHHICGEKTCVRPDHMVAVTHRQHMRIHATWRRMGIA